MARAIAANSLMISNIIANGDIAVYVNKGGASQMVLWADGSTGDTAIMAASGQSIDMYIGGSKIFDLTNDAIKSTLMGLAGDYWRIGDAGTTTHSLASEDDLLVTGKLEVDGLSSFDADMDLGINSIDVRNLLFDGYISCTTNGQVFRAKDTDNSFFAFHARDTGVGLVEVARFQGAADPYFAMGGSREFKFYKSGRAELKGIVGFGAEADLTIASGVVAVTQTYHSIITQGGADDDLDTATGGSEGDILILKANTSGTNGIVTVKNGTGANTFILAGGIDFILDHIDDSIMLIHNGTEWVELSRSSNS